MSGIVFFTKNYFTRQKYLFWGYLKWRKIRVLQAWTKLCHQILDVWKYKPCVNFRSARTDMFQLKILSDGVNMSLPLGTWTEWTVYGMKTHCLSGKEEVLGAEVNKKKSHADSLLRHERSNYYWFPWVIFNFKQCFQLSIP